MWGVIQFKMKYRTTGSGYSIKYGSEVEEGLIIDWLFMMQL